MKGEGFVNKTARQVPLGKIKWTVDSGGRCFPPLVPSRLFINSSLLPPPCSPWALYCQISIVCFLVFFKAILMVVAWVGFATIGMFIARFMRTVWGVKEMCGKRIWFQVQYWFGSFKQYFQRLFAQSVFFCTRLNFNYICLLLSVLCDRYIELLWYWRHYVPLLELFLLLCMLESGLRYCYCN